MSGIGSLLSMARSALASQQQAVAVIGNNVANATTEGYTRQRIQLAPGIPEVRAGVVFGTGVTVSSVLRTRDGLLDQQVRSSASPSEGSTLRRDILGRLETVYGAGTDASIGNALDKFWNAWSDLANNPATPGVRTVVQQSGAALAATFNRQANQLDALEQQLRDDAGTQLAQLNTMARQVAELNVRIVGSESAGGSANDLRDQRDLLIDKIAAIVPVSVIDRPNGSDQVMIGGMPLVDGVDTRTLTLTGPRPLGVRFGSSADPTRIEGGRLGALLDAVNGDIASARAGLDALASAVVTEVNAVHARGWSVPAGATGNWDPLAGPTGSRVNFFDPAPGPSLTARGMRLSDEVAASAGAIAASDTLDAAGNNAIALRMAGLRTAAPGSASGSFGGDFDAIVNQLALDTESATTDAAVNDTLRKQAIARRAGATGVSTDDELVTLIQAQQAYVAASRLVTTVNDMAQTILDLKR
ncbi:MAG: flagellar hook-associated protein FlgK [Gemmatimonadetes bacterium]|nr:flagellar hook-associated protein FlgK [Gemmatimonadota bacterium]